MSSTPRPFLDLAASCACGAVAVRVRGSAVIMLLCSCLDCQKATGSGHSAVVGVLTEAVEVTGETRSFARPAESGAVFTRSFCPICGTPLGGRSSRTPAFALLPVGLFGAASDWFLPNQLIFARSHHEWDAIAAELPRHATYRQADRL